MHLFRRVDHLKVGRKSANDLHRERQLEVSDEGPELLAGYLVALAPTNRPEARVLDDVEKLIAALFLQQFTDERTERAHVVAQSLVFVLEGDVLPA